MSSHRSVRNNPAEGWNCPALCAQEKEQEPVYSTKWAVALCTVDGQRYWTQLSQGVLHFLRLLRSKASPPASGCLWATGPVCCRWPRCPGRWCTAPPSTCWAPTSSTDTSAWTASLRTTRRLHSPKQVRFSCQPDLSADL